MNGKQKAPKPGAIFVDRGDDGQVKKLSVSLNLAEMGEQIQAAIASGDQYFRLVAFKNTYKKDGEPNSPDYNLRFPLKKGQGSGTKAVANSNVNYPI